VQIYNTLSRKKEDFQPINPGQVKMYVCGPTVYDFLHVGNFFGSVVFNLLRNWLQQAGFEVTYVYNFTDVDDKIIQRANEQGIDPQELAEKFIGEFWEDFNGLKLKPHSHNPRVTQHMDEIIDMVKSLVDQDKAYEVKGEVFYSVKSFANYGQLSGRNPDELEAGARVEVNPNKKDPADFTLWKPSKPGEPEWDSPWGKGRPGWHIECSAMNKAILGEEIDIHGGGPV